MAGKALLFELIAKDGASPAFLRVAGAADKAAVSTERATKSMGAATARLGSVGSSLTKHLTLPLLAVGAVSVAQATKWQKSMTLIQTAGGETAAKAGLLSKGLMKLAKETGTSLDQLGEGIYTIAKAGAQKWSATEQLLVMKAAAQGAKAENVDLGTATDALSTVMLDYHVSASKAVATENQLIRASGLAKTNFADFSRSLSNVMPIASALGIKQAEILGGLATMTQHGVSPQQASENMRNLLFNLAGQNNVASQAMQQLGINTVDLTKNLSSRGLTGTLAIVDKALAAHTKNGMVVVDVHKAAALATGSLNTMLGTMTGKLKAQSAGLVSGKVGITDYTKYAKSLGGEAGASALQFKSLYLNAEGFSNQLKSGKGTLTTSTAQYAKLLGGMTGAGVAMQIGGKYAADNARNVREVGKAALQAGTDVLGWNKTQDTLAVKMDKAKASLQVMAVEIGTALIPVMSKIVSWVSRGVHWFESLSSTDKKIIGWSVVVLAALGPILTIGGRLAKVGGAFMTLRTRMLGVGGAARAGASQVAEAEAAQTRAVVAETNAQIAAIERMRAAAGLPMPMGGVVGRPGMGPGNAPVIAGAAARGGGVGGFMRGPGGMVTGLGLMILGPMIGPAIGGKRGTTRNVAGTIAADSATGAGLGMLVGGPVGGAVGGLVGAGVGTVRSGAASKGLGMVLDALGASVPGVRSGFVMPKKGLLFSDAEKTAQKLNKLSFDQSVAGLHKLERAEQQVVLKNSVLGKALAGLGNATPKAAVHELSTALDQLAGRSKSSKAGIDGMSNASKTNRAYLNQAITGVEQHAAALQKSGKSAEYVRGALLSDVGALEKTALHAGFSRKSIEGMLRTMGLTPKQINTVMQTKTEQAKSQIYDLQAKINAIKQHKVPYLNANPHDAQAVVAGLQAQIDALRGKTIDVWVNTHKIGLGGPKSSNLGAAVPHAAGGSVRDGYFTVGEEGGPRGWELGYKQGSHVQLWSNKDARKLTGIDRLPGYANGTGDGLVVNGLRYATQRAANNARTRIDSASMHDIVSGIAGLLAAVHNRLAGEADLSSAARSLRDAAGSAKISSSALSRFTRSWSALNTLGSRRDRVNARLGTPASAGTAYDRLAAAQQAFGDSKSAVRAAVTGTFDISTAGVNAQVYSDRAAAPVTAGSILTQLQKAAANAGRFASLLKKLGKEGLNRALLNQLALAGPTAMNQAKALAAATPKQIAQINSGYASLNTAGASAGTYIADQMYGAGVRSAQGLVNGLLSQQKVLNAAIRHLGDSMVKQLKATLRIHSPSQVMHELGSMTGEGYIRGVRSKIDGVQQASRHLAGAAMPGASNGGPARGGDTWEFHAHGIEDPTTFVRVAETKIAHRQQMLSRI